MFLRLILPVVTLGICMKWIEFFHFSHPFPKNDFYSAVSLQFLLAFFPNLLSRGWGRVFTVLLAFLLVRPSIFLGLSSPVVTLSGVFTGAVAGIYAREFASHYLRFKNKSFLEWKSRNSGGFSDRLDLLNPHLFFLFYLLVCTLERFLTYFNYPYFGGFGLLETMYLPDISSKTAFALSMELISSLLFPLIYLFTDTIISRKDENSEKDYTNGLIFSFLINISIMSLQAFYDRNLFSSFTNLSLETNRVMGFFRDSGSSSWIIPTIYYTILIGSFIRKDTAGKYFTVIIIIMTIALFPIGLYQGRIYWLLLVTGLIFLSLFIVVKKRDNISKAALILMALLPFVVTFFVVLYALLNPESMPGRAFKSAYTLFQSESFTDYILKVDPHRYYLNLSAWMVFRDNPSFGGGPGSFIIYLRDPILQLPNPDKITDSPGSFYTGILSEFGILGTLMLFYWAFLSIKNRVNKIYVIFLLIPLLIGYQIVHPDGAFLFLLILSGVLSPVKTENQYAGGKISILIGSVLILSLFISIPVNSKNKTSVHEFRKEYLGSYQLLAYEKDKKRDNLTYHTFKGKTLWKLEGGENLEFEAFLDDSTKRKEIELNCSLLDKGYKEVSSFTYITEKEILLKKIVIVPRDAVFIEVRELESGNPFRSNPVPFAIPSYHFTKDNEYR